MDITVGTLIGGYRVEALIGSGSMGSVYSAEDTTLGRRVALKVLPPALSRDERFRERFLRESKIAAGLEHPNVIPIYGAGETEDGLLFLAMRYVDGRDLAAMLRSLGRLDPERTLELIRQVGSALDAAHGRGLVHRDVKPANILIARQPGGGEHAYLCDFGLAKHASTVSSLTGDRAIVGTVDYLAPEQIEGLPVDGRVDVYGLGCVLYETLTGDAPFRRDNDLASILAHLSDATPVPSERRPELSALLDPVVARALAKDRDERFATAAELVAAFGAALAGEAMAVPEQEARPAAAVRTFLFADVRGYTSYTKTEGDEAGAALAQRFAALVGELTPKFAGHLQELRGDEALVVFDSSRQALRFAVELQRRITADELPRPVGIGVDAGEAVPVEGGFRGGSLNRAARLCSLAKAGEILATDVVTEMAGKADGVAYGFRRTERLKGFDRPVGVVEIHSAEAAPSRERMRHVRRTLLGANPKRRLVVAGLVVAAAVAAVAGALTLAGGSSSAAAATPGTVAAIDAASGSEDGSVDAGAEFQQMISAPGEVFGFDFDNGIVARIDTNTKRVVSRVPAGGLRVRQIAWRAAFGSIWAAADGSPTLLRIDAKYPESPVAIDLPAPSSDAFPPSAEGVAVTATAVWVSYGYPKRIAKIDPRTNRVLFWRSLPQGAVFDTLMAAGADDVWVVSREDGIRLWRLDPATGDAVAQGKINDGTVTDVAVAGGILWVGVEGDGGVWKVDRNGGVLGKVDTGALPGSLVANGDSVWVSNANGGTVTRIDAGTDAVEQIDTGHRPQGLAVGGGTLFASIGLSAADARARIVGDRVLAVSEPGDSGGTLDPAQTASEGESSLTAIAGARLFEYQPLASGGARIVPEIAEAAPRVSRDQRTWTFTVRDGFRFSPPSGQVVTAETVRASIERALSPGLQAGYCAGSVLPDLVGMKAFADGKAKHIAGLTASGRTVSLRLERPSGSLLARLSRSCLTIVPIGTPIVAGGVGRPVPSAGPYYVDTHIPGQQTVVLRNPNYGGPRPRNLDAVILTHNVEPADGIAAVQRGDADIAVAPSAEDAGPLAAGEKIARQYGPSSAAAAKGGQQWYQAPSSGVFYLQLRSDGGALANPRARRAVSLALDRTQLAAVFRGVPSGLMIGAGIPGHGITEPMPLRADPRRARALLGGRPLRIRLVVRSARDRNVRLGQLIKRQLGRAGIAVDVRAVPDEFGYAHDPANKVDAVLGGWFPDYPDPYSSLNVLLDPIGGLGDIFSQFYVTDPAWQRRLRAADRTTGSARAATYARLDRDLATQYVPTAVIGGVGGIPAFFSKRVGCRRSLPLYQGLPDLLRLCVEREAR